MNSVESHSAISSQSAAHLGLLAAASVANMRSFDVAGNLKGATLSQEEMQSYAFIRFLMCSITPSNHVFSAIIMFFGKPKCFTFITLQT